MLGSSGSRQSPTRSLLVKHSEPGPLPSTVVTRFSGTMGPSDSCARHAPSACSVFTPLAQASRVAHSTCCTHAAPNIPVDRQSWSIASAWHLGLPRIQVGSASTSSLSEPAPASLALRPAYSLDLLSGAFFFGASSQGVTSLPRPMASEVNRQFLGRDFHPRVYVHLSRRTRTFGQPPQPRCRSATRYSWVSEKSTRAWRERMYRWARTNGNHTRCPTRTCASSSFLRGIHCPPRRRTSTCPR